MASLRLEMMKVSNLMEAEMGSLEISVSRAEAYTFSEYTSREELIKYQYIDNRISYYELKKSINEEVDDDTLADFDKDEFITMIMNIKKRFAHQTDCIRVNVSMPTALPRSANAMLNSQTSDAEIRSWGNKALITITAKVMSKNKVYCQMELRSIAPSIIRAYLIQEKAQLQMDEIYVSDNNDEGIYYIGIKEWEKKNITMNEKRIILGFMIGNDNDEEKRIDKLEIQQLEQEIEERQQKYFQASTKRGIKFPSIMASETELKKFMLYVKSSENVLNTQLNKKEDLTEEGKQLQKRYQQVQNEEVVNRATNNPVGDVCSVKNPCKPTKITPTKVLAPRKKKSNKLKDGIKCRKQEKEVLRRNKKLDKMIEQNFEEDNQYSPSRNISYQQTIKSTPKQSEDKLRSFNVNVLPPQDMKQNTSTIPCLKHQCGNEVVTEQKFITPTKNQTNYSETQIEDAIMEREDTIIIDYLTTNDEIDDLTIEEAQYVYFDCLSKRGIAANEKDINELQIEDLRKYLREARDQEKDIFFNMTKNEPENNNLNKDRVSPKETSDPIWEAQEEEKHSIETLEIETPIKNQSENMESSTQKNEPKEQENGTTISSKAFKQSTLAMNKSTKLSHPQQIKLNKNPPEMEIRTKKKINQQNTKGKEWTLVTNNKYAFKGLGHSAQNLLGMCTNEIITTQQPKNNIKDYKHTTSTKHERTTFYMRVNLAMNKESNHIPSLIKKFVRIIRQADPTILVLPFLPQSKQDSLIITDEKHLPETEIELQQWAGGIHTTKFGKLGFSLRVSNTMKYKELKGIIFSWCTNNGCYVKFDNIQSDSIFRAGWISHIHPMFHNRDKLKEHITRDHPDLASKIHIYPRNIFIKNDDNTRTITEAVAIDGDYHARDKIMKMLHTTKIDDKYVNAMYLPFRATGDLTTMHHRQAMQTHNEYIKNMYTKVLTVSLPQSEFKILNSTKSITFCDWIKLYNSSGKDVFYMVECYDNTKVRLLYSNQYESEVAALVLNLFNHVTQTFGTEVATTILGSENNYTPALETGEIEIAYAAECAKRIKNTPTKTNIDHIPFQRNKTTTYYGKPPIDKTNPTSYARAVGLSTWKTNPNKIKNNEKDLEALQKTVESLQSSLTLLETTMEQKLNAKIISNITNQMSTQREQIYQELTHTKTELETKIESSSTELQTIILQKEKAVEFKVAELAHVIRSTQTEAEKRAETRAHQMQDQFNTATQHLLAEMRALMSTNPKPPNVVERGSHGGAIK